MELRDLIRRVIEREYDGNQAEFARSIGESTAVLNRWVTGQVKLPRPASRRKLARKLGVRHVDILVAAGELWPSEVADVPPPPAPEHSELDRLWGQLPPAMQESLMVTIRETVKLNARLRQVDEAATLP